METLFAFIHNIFSRVPEIALFLSLALGYLIGKVSFGKFQLGGVAGSLLAAVALSQFDVHINDTVKSILFALFIFAVGYTSGATFFRSLGRKSLREIFLAVVLALSGLLTVIVLAKLLHLDKGLAAGIASGGLTQSAIMGTAESAINALNLSAAETARLVTNISVGYGVTYIFGSFGAIIICVNLMEKFMGRSIRDDALKAEAAQHSGGIILGQGEQFAVPHLVGRIFTAGPAEGKTVQELEDCCGLPPVTVERIKRGSNVVPVTPSTRLLADDKILIIGRRSAILNIAAQLGREIAAEDNMEVLIQAREVVLTNENAAGKTLKELSEQTTPEMRHGLYITGICRNGKNISVEPDTKLAKGDIITLYGALQDVRRAAAAVGYPIVVSDKTDMVFMSLGLVFGLLIGMLVVHASSIPITLGSGGGCLLSGLLFGWFRSHHMNMGALPSQAAQLLKDLGLAGFVAVVGLNYGMQAVHTVRTEGLTIFLAGVLVTIIPLLITMLFGRYVLRYDNVAVFAGALSGARSANPAFGEVLNKAENSVPTVPFAITYALANVFLTLLGPLVVALA
ncbi:MAG: aspartate-alanine antiporter [Desulfovibrionaceae bacterium]|nr:aspartate-alanine antiporter [Desulfovibrionaceae bacterium]